ncbi:MAG: protein kinase [Ktedonobacteraceae bacterium]
MTTSRFCPQCGADNAPANALCHACQQPLAISAGMHETSALLNERYMVLAEVGAGGFGAVYQARDTWEKNRLVAVKQINLKGLSSQEIIEATDAFNREAQILTTLNHPLLPRIFDRFSDPEHWYLVMNFIDGSTLDAYLQQHVANALPAKAGLPLGETLAIGLHLCNVLHYLHTQQPPVIFRDIKPGNVMRTPSGRLYLIDFGIARHFKLGQAKDTIPFGSPGFAAPEQYGRAQTTPQADIYSLGALLYCLISGDDPADHPFQFPPLRLYGIDGINELDALIQRMVALDVTQRPADILEVRSDIQALQSIHAQAHTQHIWLPPQGQTPPAASAFRQQHLFSSVSPARKTSRRNVVTAALVVGGAMLIGGVATALSNIQPQTNLTYQSSYQNGIDPDTAATATAQDDAATATATNQVAAVPLNGPTYWSSDLSYAAVVNMQQNQIELYKVPSQQSMLNIGISANFPSSLVQWSLDNSTILALASTGMLKAWNAKNGQELFTFTIALNIGPSPMNSISLSPDGQYCAINYSDPNSFDSTSFTLLQTTNGKQLFQNTLPYYSYSTVSAWSPDSRYLAFPDSTNGSGDTTWSVEIWDSHTYQKVSSFGAVLPIYANGSSISFIVWLAGGEKLATIINGYVWITDIASNQTEIVLEGTFHSTLSPLWSPDETFLAAIDSETLTIWSTANRQTVQLNGTYGSSGNLATFAWSADSKSITVVDNNNVISQWAVG